MGNGFVRGETVRLWRKVLRDVGGQMNNVQVSGVSFLKIAGETLNLTVTGFAGGRDGQVLVLGNRSDAAITLKHDSRDSADGARLSLPGAADLALAAGSSLLLVYDGAEGVSRSHPNGEWVLVDKG